MSVAMSVVPMAESDIDALFEFRERVFPNNWKRLHRDRWRWLYQQNPAAGGQIPTWLLRTQDRIAGSISAVPCRMRVGPDVIAAYFGTDYFVERSFLGLPALRLLMTMLAQSPVHIGANLSESARKLFLKKGYVDLGSQLYVASAGLTDRCQDDPTALSWLKQRVFRGTRGLARAAPYRTEINRPLPALYADLWKRIRASRGAGLEKDEDYMRWRYQSCPIGEPRFISALKGDRLVAMAVVDCRHLEDGQRKTGLILDLLLPDGERMALAVLIAACLEYFERSGCSACLLHWNAQWAKPVIRSMGFHIQGSDIGLMVWVAAGATSLKILQTPGSWSLILGDTDRF